MLALVTRTLIWLNARLANLSPRNDKGEVSIEYVLVGGLAGVAIIAGMVTFKGDIGEWFTELGTKIDAVFS